MIRFKTLLAAAALGGAMLLSACDDGYGYSGVSLGYGVADYDPYYGGYGRYAGYGGDPYWGWYGDYYYPGTGYYVYDRYNNRHRWNDQQRGYWQGRAQQWRGGNRPVRPTWRDFNGGQGRGAYTGGGYTRGGPGPGAQATQGTQGVQSTNPGVVRTAPTTAGSGRGGGWRGGGGGSGGGRSGGNGKQVIRSRRNGGCVVRAVYR